MMDLLYSKSTIKLEQADKKIDNLDLMESSKSQLELSDIDKLQLQQYQSPINYIMDTLEQNNNQMI
jgi:DNA transposition AAA+ family ATPase